MGRASVKKNKNIYFQARENLGLTREDASELLELISADKLERIENEKCQPSPFEVQLMSQKYKMPELCNYYCANKCDIGKESVQEIKSRDLSQIVLQVLSALNSLKNQQERLIEITADGEVDGNELEDFVRIQKELEKISLTVETLQLWSERMIAQGKIDSDKYNELYKKFTD